MEIGINYIFISTDNFSFKSKKLSENSETTSLNNYSKNKKKSERKIIQIYPKSLIIRTNFYCIGNSKRKSFSDTILKTINLEEKLIYLQMFFILLYMLNFYLLIFLS